MTSYLEFRAVEKRFGKVEALSQVNFAVERGSVVAVLGPNGAGKSTLFGCLLGLLHLSKGEILLSGGKMTNADRSRIGYVPERVALYPHRTLWENALFFARLKQQDPSELDQQLKRVGLHKIRTRKVRELSKGMLQRLGLAIALCGQPELLVLDEPFNGLDPLVLDDLQNILREEHDRGATLLISTHTMSAIEHLATHVAVLLHGQLISFGRIESLREEHNEENSLEAIYQQIARSRRNAVREEAFV